MLLAKNLLVRAARAAARPTVSVAAGVGSTRGKHHSVIVIGGGVVGTSVLYHLAKLGVTDACLLERKVLTAGSTWHAAGGFHALNGDAQVSALQRYTIALYEEIEAVSGQACGVQMTGGVNIATTPERYEYLRYEHQKHRTMGIESELLSPEECCERIPILNPDGLLGGLYDENEGHLDCSGVTWAYAKSAQKVGGAVVHQHTKVEALNPDGNGGWEVETDAHGTLTCDHVVNAGGLWAREVGAMAGVHLPLLPMAHHYLITEPCDGVRGPQFGASNQIPIGVDLDGESYLRQERGGILIGVYEKDCLPWSADATPWDYGENELLQPDLDRISPQLEKAYHRYPALAEAGVRTVVCGAFTFAPDGNPLVGPVEGTGLAAPGRDVRNFWSACAVMAGFAQGGGVGLTLAEWLVHGQPVSYPDVFAMDVARYGPWASKAYTLAKSQENYTRRFQIAYPNEELPAARGVKRSPVHATFAAAPYHAVHGVGYGLEYAKFFGGDGRGGGGGPATETPSLRRDPASFDRVAEECASVRNEVGMIEMGTYAKYDVAGPGAAAYLDRLLACRLPTRDGRMAMAPMLDARGRLAGDLTVARLARDRFLLVGSGGLQGFHTRWFEQQRRALTDTGDDASAVTISNVTDALGGFAVAGPRSRELLARLVGPGEDVSNDASGLRFMDVRASLDVGPVPATVARVSVTGELGYEVYCAASQHAALFDALTEAGDDLGLRNIGTYALNSLRLEKSYGVWGAEYTPEYTPKMAGLGRFVAEGKAADFVGKDVCADAQGDHRLVTLKVDGDAANADCWGFEPVWCDGEYAGYTTSGGYGHAVGSSIAMAYLKGDALAKVTFGDAATLEVSVVGERVPALLCEEPLYDPEGKRLFS